MDFVRLLDDARGGDALALDQLLDRWRPLLTLQARLWFRDSSAGQVDVVRVVDTTLAQAGRDLFAFRGNTQKDWVRHLCLLLASQAALARRTQVMNGLHGFGDPPASRSTVDCESLEGGIDCERELELAVAIEALPQMMREVLLRVALDQQPFDDIARALACSPVRVRILWIHALRALREALSG